MSEERDNLLPPTATAFEDAQSQTSARLLDAPTRVIREARQGATAPKALLPWLAWERSVHHPTSDEAAMRARVDASFADHLAYGTPGALAAEVELDTGVPVRIVEFMDDPALEWPDFSIEAEFDPGEPTPDISGVLPSTLMRKNVRDWPSSVRVRPRQPPAAMKTGASTFVGRTLRVLPEFELPRLPEIVVGAAARLMLRIEVNPQ